MQETMNKEIIAQTTHQKKMEAIQEAISMYAYLGAAIIFAVLLAYQFILCALREHQPFISTETFLDIINSALIAVAIVITAVPEGLPLAVSICAVFSTDKLKDEKLLIKKLEALENAGKITDVLTAKTGTLTTSRLTVERFWCNEDLSVTAAPIMGNVLDKIHDCIIKNSDASTDVYDKKKEFFTNGSPVDVCMMEYLEEYGVELNDKLVDRERNWELITKIPFDPKTKRMTKIYKKIFPEVSDTMRIVTKGAPEEVIKKCTMKLTSNDEEIDFNGIGEEGSEFLNNHASRIAGFGDGLTPILYAYRDISIRDFDQLKRVHNNFDTEKDRLILEENLTMLAMYGLKDTIREGVEKTIEVLAGASTRTRIVSGDHEMTVKKLAAALLIVDCEENENAIISGREFEQKCEKYMTQVAKEDGSYEFNYNHETYHNEL
jgi:magnesium-transporting ATPase (P-type)